MATRQGQLDLADWLAVLVPVGQGAIALFLAGDGREAHPLGAIDRPPVIGLELVAQHRAVAIGQQLASPRGKPLKGGHQGLQVGVVVGVVELDVGE